jgi:hypothetical protein
VKYAGRAFSEEQAKELAETTIRNAAKRDTPSAWTSQIGKNLKFQMKSSAKYKSSFWVAGNQAMLEIAAFTGALSILGAFILTFWRVWNP